MIGFLSCILCASMISAESIPNLKLLHVVFAHKPYAPILDIIGDPVTSFPKNLTYDYFNSAPLDMPNAGKLNMYNLGVYLRETYGRFLGSIYTDEIMRMRTGGYPLSIISGQLVNAGLWPPAESQMWDKNVNWQPLPSDYVSMEQDTLLLGTECPNFMSEMEEIIKTREIRNLLTHHVPLFDYVSHYTKTTLIRPSELALFFATLETKADLNVTLPRWTSDIFPHGGLFNVTLLEYDLLSRTNLQKQLNGGTLLKDIIGNTVRHIQGTISRGRKLMMYSGNDRNIAGVLKNLNLWSPHIPNEAAAVIFEVYSFNNSRNPTYGIKINYYTGVDGDTIPLRVPNCTEVCPLKKFINLVFDSIPQNEDLLCGRPIPGIHKELDYGSYSPSIKPANVLIFSLVILIFSQKLRFY